MRCGKLVVATMLACGAASAAEPAEPKQVLVKATIFKVRADAYKELKLDDAFGKDGTKFLDADELADLMRKAKTAGMDVVSRPTLLILDGQPGVFAVAQPRSFATRLEVGTDANGGATFRPKEETVEVGVSLRCTPRVAADGRMAVLRVLLTERSVADKVATLPVTSLVAPVFEGGSRGVPVPFTQFLQKPVVNTAACEKTVAVPTGRCVLVKGGSRECEARYEFGPPVISQVPYLNRLFKNVGTAKDTEHTLLALTAVVDPTAADLGQAGPPKPVAPPVMPVAAVAPPVAARPVPAPMPTAARPAEPQVFVEAMVLRVSGKTCTELGLGLKPGWATSVTVDPATFQGTLRALKEAGKVDVLSRPQLLLTDNQQGYFFVGSQVDLGSSATHPKPMQAKVGIEMRCTPRVSPAGLSTLLRVEFAESRMGCPVPVSGVPQPCIDTQSVESSVRVPTGKSVLLEVGSRAGETHLRKVVGNREATTGERPATAVEVTADTEHTLLWLKPVTDPKPEDYATHTWSAKDVTAIHAKPTMTGGVSPMCRMVMPNFAVVPMVTPATATLPPACCFPYHVSPALRPSFVTVRVPAVPVELPVVACSARAVPAAVPAKHADILTILMADYHAACKAGDAAKARTIAAHCLELDPTCFGGK